MRTIADGVALIATQTLEAFDSSVWVRRDGGWVCAAHTETPAEK